MGRGKMVRDFLAGFQYFLRGVKLITLPGLRRFVLIPLIINVLVFTAAILFGTGQFRDLLEWLLPAGDSLWIELARTVSWIIFSAVVFLIVFFTFTIVANLLGAPFNGLLSEKIENSLAGDSHGDTGGIRALLASILPSILSELRKIGYFLIFGAAVLILTLLPILNMISPLIWGIFTSWMLALEYIAYPMENNNIYFSRARARLKGSRAITFGFGLAVMFATLIPVVNFAVMPSAIAGATVMWVERLKQQ
jgi:CysZ protein